MSYSVQTDIVIANQTVIDVVTGQLPAVAQGAKIAKRLRALWVAPDNTEYDLGVLAGFAGRSSFSGMSASLTIAWPREKNPRKVGAWQQLLVPDDSARVKINLLIQTVSGEAEIPLLLGVPSPGGVSENYGREVIEIKLEDVTGVAARQTNYTLEVFSGDTADALDVASSVLPVPFVCLYPTQPVDACVKRYPNALLAADDVLISQQDNLNPLTGQNRIRYGDRDGRIIYRIVEAPDSGNPFQTEYPYSGADFEYGSSLVNGGMRVETLYSNFSAPRINPYLDLGSMVALKYSAADLDEVVQLSAIGWRVMPQSESMSLKGRREYTL